MEDIIGLPNIRMIHQGLTEYRRDVVPEFIRFLKPSDEMMHRISRIPGAIAFENHIMGEFLTRNYVDVEEYFHNWFRKDIIYHEYYLTD